MQANRIIKTDGKMLCFVIGGTRRKSSPWLLASRKNDVRQTSSPSLPVVRQKLARFLYKHKVPYLLYDHVCELCSWTVTLCGQRRLRTS